jgi:pyrroloquinoline-quinone synthase
MKSVLVPRIDQEIEKRSLLNHPFYQLWSNGSLTRDHLQGYAKEYFQLVKAVPTFVGNVISSSLGIDGSTKRALYQNLNEELCHVEPWKKFAVSLGINEKELVNYPGLPKTNNAVACLNELTRHSLEQAAAAMYAYEKELPKISRSKINGLEKFYGIASSEALNYFTIHEEADVRHAKTWSQLLGEVSRKGEVLALEAATASLKAQNRILDCVQEKYVQNISNC